jgi:hypothetical protein
MVRNLVLHYCSRVAVPLGTYFENFIPFEGTNEFWICFLS